MKPVYSLFIQFSLTHFKNKIVYKKTQPLNNGYYLIF